MDDYLQIIKERVKLKEGVSKIEKILVNLYMNGSMSTKELSKTVFLPVPVITAIKKECINLELVMQQSGVKLTKKGYQYVEQVLGYKDLKLDAYKELLIHKEMREKLLNKLCEEYEEIFQNRPSADVTVDQAKSTVETSFRRAFLCLEYETLIHKKILCIGDDDFISVAVAFLLKYLYTNMDSNQTQICVFDVDERIIKHINELAERENLPLKAVQMDFRDPLPISYASYFDTFFTDPPYTMDGLTLFLSRGIGALKKEKGGTVFLSFGQKPINETLDLQNIILKHGLVIQKIYKGFNQYEGASLLGSNSQMMVLETTDYLHTVIDMDAVFLDKMYTADFRAHFTQYECKKCKETFQVGKDQKIKTIEELKEKKCPVCGGGIFVQLKNNHIPEKEMLQKSLGRHILADFFECDREVLGDIELVRKYLHEAAKKAQAAIVTEEFHKFHPYGVSGAIIIKESHLTIHTWPEYQYAAVDIFTCGSSLKLWIALQYLKEKLVCEQMDYNEIARGKLKTGDCKLGVEIKGENATRKE